MVQFYALFHLPLSDLRDDQYSLSCDQKLVNFASKLDLVHSDSTNIGQIANLKAGGERAHNTAPSTYWPYHNTIRTHILNLNQMSRNRIFVTMVLFQPFQKPMVQCLVRATTSSRESGSGALVVSNADRALGSYSNPDRSRVTRNHC